MTVYFGGPDKAPGMLRDLLQDRVEGVPAGGEISMATYYFCDMELARALIRAQRRGVRLKLILEGQPRTLAAGRQARHYLKERIGDICGLHHRRLLGIGPKRHLHSKIYYFSHPAPHVLVGSFNPSGDPAMEPEIIDKIGDQDRGHNCLVMLSDPVLVETLRRHIGELWQKKGRYTGKKDISNDPSCIFVWQKQRLMRLI